MHNYSYSGEIYLWLCGFVRPYFHDMEESFPQKSLFCVPWRKNAQSGHNAPFSPSAADFMVSPRCASVLLTKAAKKVVEGRGEGGLCFLFPTVVFGNKPIWDNC